MKTDQMLQRAVDFHLKGNLGDAENLYSQILGIKPHDVVSLHHLGVIRYHQGQNDTAVKLISEALRLNPNIPEAYSNLALALVAQGKVQEAIKNYHRSIELNPQSADSHNNLASAYLALGLIDEAIQSCRKALSLRSNFPLAHYNLGVAYQRQRKPQEAIASFQEAIRCHPPFAEAYCNLGLEYMTLGQRENAVAAYRKAIECRPNFPEAFNNLGQPLSDLQKLEEASEAYRQALALRPSYTEASVNLAHTLRRRGLTEEAVEVCRQALVLNPGNIKAQIEIVNLRRQIADWQDYDADTEKVRALVSYMEPFVFLSISFSPAEQLACASSWAKNLPRGAAFSHDRPRKPGRLRIGYLSCDFRRHATAYLMAELFERHDREKLEVYAYSYGYEDGSDIRQRLIRSFDHFVDIQMASHEAAAQRIYEDQIDILIDLKGYTGDARTEILVNRPAPIQVNYVGYPGTMGADFIDYIVADSFVAPMEQAPYYSEKIVHLPYCYQPNDSKRVIASTQHTRQMHGLPDNAFVFCSFNGAYKITPSVFDVWMRLLKAIPNSVLWLLKTADNAETNLRNHALARGVDAGRLYFAQPLDLPEHLARHRLADLFLDTLPINAHTTASDSLWAGLPLVTLAGDVFVGRVAGSTLRAVGLPEMITYSLAEYEARALDLATNPAKLAEIRQKLINNLPTAPLFDSLRYTKHLEAAYLRMAEIRSAGQPLQPIIVNP